MRTNLRFAFIFSLTLLTVACQPGRRSDSDKGPYKVKIADYSREQGYHLKVEQLFTLDSITQAKGSAAEFLVQPRFQNGKINGHPLQLQTIKSGEGVYIAKDSDTLQALTLYTHFERLKKLDQAIGLEKLNPGPRKVIVQALFARGAAGADADNAFYSADLDAILFSKFTSDALPLMANGGVVAHEHFHSIFQKIMTDGEPLALTVKALSKIRYSPHGGSTTLSDIETGDIDEESGLTRRQEYDLVLLRAFNEGLADVWGWAYSGDPEFVGRSVPKFKYERNVGRDLIAFSSKEWILSEMDRLSRDSHNVLAYRLGTEIARFARAALEEAYGKDATTEQKLKAVAEFVPRLKNFVASVKENDIWEPAEAMTVFVKGLRFSEKSSCANLSEKFSPETRRIFFNICQSSK